MYRLIILLCLLMAGAQQASAAECGSTANRSGCEGANGAVGTGPNGAGGYNRNTLVKPEAITRIRVHETARITPAVNREPERRGHRRRSIAALPPTARVVKGPMGAIGTGPNGTAGYNKNTGNAAGYNKNTGTAGTYNSNSGQVTTYNRSGGTTTGGQSNTYVHGTTVQGTTVQGTTVQGGTTVVGPPVAANQVAPGRTFVGPRGNTITRTGTAGCPIVDGQPTCH